jgi:hypothetical protein
VTSAPCDLLQVESELDLLDAELADEMPAHMRAFARAHADGRNPPTAPLLLRLPSTLTTARNACTHDVLLDRGLALSRLVVPLIIEDDPAVTKIRAEAPTWAGLERLAAARDAVALAKFGVRAIELLHTLHGSDGPVAEHDAPGPPIEGWQAREPALDAAAILDTWHVLATRLGVAGTVRVDRASSAKVQPRTFVVEPKREAIIVVPPTVDTPAARFAVLHELGHAFCALGLTPGVPRAVDEAAASYVARAMEVGPSSPASWLPPRWPSALAAAARARRLAIAAMLDQVERRLPELEDVPGGAPPWALWHDPGAQAAYVTAEAMADRVRAELGPNPPRGQVLRALIAERDQIDQR